MLSDILGGDCWGISDAVACITSIGLAQSIWLEIFFYVILTAMHMEGLSCILCAWFYNIDVENPYSVVFF